MGKQLHLRLGSWEGPEVLPSVLTGEDIETRRSVPLVAPLGSSVTILGIRQGIMCWIPRTDPKSPVYTRQLLCAHWPYLLSEGPSSLFSEVPQTFHLPLPTQILSCFLNNKNMGPKVPQPLQDHCKAPGRYKAYPQ